MASKKQPNERPSLEWTGVPTSEEIRALPRWARVAFAARCARRVQPLFAYSWPEAPEVHVKALDTAITFAERAAAAAFDDRKSNPTAESVLAASAAAEAVGANDAVDCANAASFTDPAYVYLSDDGAASAAAAAAAAGGAWREPITLAMRRDFEMLKRAATQENWTAETPVPPEFFGPLWPEGEPEGWPVAARTKDVLNSEGLKSLPRLAQVAFAARCARRVFPLIAHSWPRKPNIGWEERIIALAERTESIDAKIVVPEAFGAVFQLHSLSDDLAGDPEFSSEAQWVGDAELRIREVCRSIAEAGYAAGAADIARWPETESNAEVIETLNRGLKSRWHDDTIRTVDEHAAAAAGRAEGAAGRDWREPITRAMRRDFELLKAAARAEGWTDETPVPPEFFGPLWPWGAPEGWPKHEPTTAPPHRQQLLLEFAVPEDTPHEEIDRLVQQFVHEASRMHIAAGGSGLKVADLHVWQPEPSHVEAPQ